MTLIDKNSATYRRRLIRQLNAAMSKSGLYYTPSDGGPRRVALVRYSRSLDVIKYVSLYFTGWNVAYDLDGFRDGNGQHICASREVR